MRPYTWLIFLLLIFDVNAQAIGVSPAKLEIKLLRGSEAYTSFTIFNPSDKPIDFNIYNKEFSEWFEFIPDQGKINANSNKEISVWVKPNELVSNGEYNTLIYVGIDDDSSGSGLSLNIGTAIKAKVGVTGKQLVNLFVRDVVVRDAEQDGFVIFEFDVLNNGNVKVKPNVEIKITKNNITIDRFERELEEVMPGKSERLITEWSTKNRDVGDYIAFVRLKANGEIIKQTSLAFKILPYGELAVDGELRELAIEDASIEGIVKIKAIFLNTGNTTVKAKLKGEVYFNNNLIDTFESEELIVIGGKEKELVAYVKVNQSGDYTIKASVFYNRKQTPIKELSFSIKEKNTPNQHIFGTAIMFSIVVSGYLSYEVFRKINYQRKK